MYNKLFAKSAEIWKAKRSEEELNHLENEVFRGHDLS